MCSEMQLSKISAETVNELKDLFGEKLKSVILYGSYARGDYDTESDIDVFVLVDMSSQELAKYQRNLVEIATSISLENDVFLSLHEQDVATFEKWRDVVPFYKNVVSEGVMLNP